MSKVLSILKYEEGYQVAPFIGISGYPTVGSGIKIGTKNLPGAGCLFWLPDAVSDEALQRMLDGKKAEMAQHPLTAGALKQCNTARTDILYSMAWQLGVDGLVEFREALNAISHADFATAAARILESGWAKQRPARAMRHAAVIRSGDYRAYRGLI